MKNYQFVLLDKKPSTSDSVIVDLNAGGIYWNNYFHFLPPMAMRIILALQIVDKPLSLKDIVDIAWHGGYMNYYQERSAQVAIANLNKRLGHQLVKRYAKRHRDSKYQLNP